MLTSALFPSLKGYRKGRNRLTHLKCQSGQAGCFIGSHSQFRFVPFILAFLPVMDFHLYCKACNSMCCLGNFEPHRAAQTYHEFPLPNMPHPAGKTHYPANSLVIPISYTLPRSQSNGFHLPTNPRNCSNKRSPHQLVIAQSASHSSCWFAVPESNCMACVPSSPRL